MQFYSGIAPFYDLVFPYDAQQVSFLETVADPHLARCPGVRAGKGSVSGRRMVDIGCGTGTVLSAFSERFKKLIGVDIDSELLKRAAKKVYPGEEKKFELLLEDMSNLESVFPEEEFSLVTCLGNTLVHLTSPGKLQHFLKFVRSMLETDGVFVVQIINYDRVLDCGLRGLPTIESADITFEQYYSAVKENGIVDYSWTLSVPEQDLEISSTMPLMPLRKHVLEGYLADAGFTGVDFFGSYAGEPWKPDSLLTIAVCG